MHLNSLKSGFLLTILCQPLHSNPTILPEAFDSDPSSKQHKTSKEDKPKKPKKSPRKNYELLKWLQKPKQLTEHTSFFELLLFLAYEFKIEFSWVIAEACIKSMGILIATYMQYSIITQLKPRVPSREDVKNNKAKAILEEGTILDAIRHIDTQPPNNQKRSFDLGKNKWFSEMFCQLLGSTHALLCSSEGKNFDTNSANLYKFLMYLATLGITFMFVLLGTYSEEITNKLIQMCIKDSFTRPFKMETSNYLSQNGFQELMNKTHRFHMTHHQALKAEALESISPLFAKMLTESVIPTIVQIVSLLARQIFISIYERSIVPIVSFIFTLIFIAINMSSIYSKVSNASFKLNEALRSVNSGSADTVSNALLVAQSGKQTPEIQGRRQVIDKAVIATYQLNKVKNNVASWLTKYGIMYGMIHAIFGGDLQAILKPALTAIGVPLSSSLFKDVVNLSDFRQTSILLIFSALIVYTDLRSFRNALARVIENQIELTIDEATLRRYRGMIFSSDRLPYDASAPEFQLNPHSENIERLKIEMDEGFSYKNKEAADQELQEKKIRAIQIEVGKAIMDDY